LAAQGITVSIDTMRADVSQVFSCLYGSSGGEIELQEIVNGLINTQMYNSPGIFIALLCINVAPLREPRLWVRCVQASELV
ncbi:hypothetical protein, partial [Mycobacterium tuberculosis]|uniref:hypothetical protein n=1 Tax=Mycobacterium tuberculosis TaxID=1773 RepID=UPI001BAE406C